MISRNVVLGLLLAVGIGGYPLLAAFLSLGGADDSRLPSIVLRLFVAVLAVVALVTNRKSIRVYHPAFLLCFLLFWVAYLFRIVNDGWMAQLTMPIPAPEVLSYVAVFVLIPALGMLPGLNPWSAQWSNWLLTVITVVTLALIALQFQDIAAQLGDRTGVRFSLERLNPISVGYVGATMLVLGVVAVFRPMQAGGLPPRLIFGAAALAGLVLLIAAASRGPAAAAAIALLAYLLVPLRPGRVVAALGLAVAIAGIVYVTQRLMLSQYSFDVWARFQDAAAGYDGSSLAREDSFSLAWNAFLSSPVFGSGLFVRGTDFYAHNLILEALMATGIVGGLAYLAMLGMMVVACLRLLAREDGYEWIALIAILFAVGGMTSGAHYSSDIHWLTLAAVVITDRKLIANQAMRRAQKDAEARADAIG